MKYKVLSIIVALLSTLFVANAHAEDDALAPWRKDVKVHAVAPGEGRHSIHAYFNTCPESPDGKYVLYYTSGARDGETGDLRILERATGKETVIAEKISTEDAHRAACQQWVNGGKTVVYHDDRGGRWFVVAIDLATLKKTILAEDRQLGYGSQTQPLVPIYGCHWNPGKHRDLELVNVQTGEITTPVTAEQFVAEYSDWVEKKFGTKELSIFFPVLSPDGNKVFFKPNKPSGGNDFRSMQSSFRDGKVVYDLANKRFIRLIDEWGHPSWDPTSQGIFEKGQVLMNLETGKTKRFAPGSPSDHPTLSPDGNLFVTDADVTKREFGKPGDWAIVVGSTKTDEWLVVAQFNNTHGAKSWRVSHPHPAFSADGRRIYYNVSDGDWTRLFVAEAGK
jgi:Tol biopolymer transport system component